MSKLLFSLYFFIKRTKGVFMETKRIMGVGLNIWGCREQFNGLRSTGRHLNLFWKNVTTKSRWPSWSKAPVSWHGFESWWLPHGCWMVCGCIAGANGSWVVRWYEAWHEVWCVNERCMEA